MAVAYDANDSQGDAFSGFAQGADTSVDGRKLYRSTNVKNLFTTYNDVRVGSIPLDAQQYEAERASITDASVVNHVDAIGGQKVGHINNADSAVTFVVRPPNAGPYTIYVRYDNGTGGTSSHQVSVNGASPSALSCRPTVDRGKF